ncbi:MAG: aldehyde ferredoxin oxidoreductase family protein [Halanaerobiales bacterium]|nr:aldehyde ferredoxin oxidoreductase family protein [Halanaerobiales bacterium]
MGKGYMGKILWVDLTNRTLKDEIIPDEIYEKFLSGYGLAAKVIFDRQKPGLGPFDPENIFGVMSGLLTNTYANFNGRFMIVGKSPLTGTWGDANCGGDFAPAIKKTGYDGIFFIGKSEKPVYLLIDGDQKELVDASDLWGKDTNETDDILKDKHGKDFKIACIGQGGENLSLIAGVVNDKGRIAARSGLGALMGSKNLKALCLFGHKKAEMADEETMLKYTHQFLDGFRKKYKHPLINKMLGYMLNSSMFSGLVRYLNEHNLAHQPEDFERWEMKKWGTAGITAFAANIGDSPVKNWKGVGYVDFPTKDARYISNNYVTQYETKKYNCYGCPLGCGGIVTVDDGPYPLKETHKPEYETLCGFGTMLLANDVHRVIKVNDMLNRAGIDTISCAVVVAWAYEAYENKVLDSEKDLDGWKLEWGNSEAVVELVRKIINGEGIGKILKDGVKRAAEYFGNGSEKYAMHVGGQELPMHDCRNPQGGLGLGVAYQVEPTPGRHTSSMDMCSLYRTNDTKERDNKFKLHPYKAKPSENAQGDELRDGSCFMDLVNGLGLCAFAFDNGVTPPIIEWINASTGWDKDFEEYMEIAHRIKTIRHAFNLREGIKPDTIKLPNRAKGVPPLKKGPNKNMTPNFDGAGRDYYIAMGWNPETAYPLPETLDELDLLDVKAALYK